MAGPDRRVSILCASAACFAERGFAGATTAALAASSAVNEALLFRHFGSKQALYLACVDSAWGQVRARCADLFANEPEELHWRMPGRAFLELTREQPDVVRMWMRSLVETTGVAEIDAHLAALMLEVHRFVAESVERSAAAGGVLADRDAATEAWSIVAIGLLGASAGTRGIIGDDAFDGVVAAHREWVTGSPA